MKLLGMILFWLGCVGLVTATGPSTSIHLRHIGIFASLPLIVAGATLVLILTHRRKR